MARLRGMAAEADSVTGFGESLWSPSAGEQVHERAENSLRRGIGAYYQLGQLLAAPALLDRPEISAGQRLRPMQEFTFDVSAEEMGEGGEFTRRLLAGPFHPTTRVDYCDPASDDD